MRDGSTRRRSTSSQHTTWTPERVQVNDWRRHGRLDDLRALAEGAGGLTLSRELLHALLEDLQLRQGERGSQPGQIFVRQEKIIPVEDDRMLGVGPPTSYICP